jgi:uncharacterized membrane protein
MELKMNRYFWLLDHPAGLLALVAAVVFAFALPLQDVYASAAAAVMMAVAAGMAIWTHFRSAGYGR